jgi:exonuclease III
MKKINKINEKLIKFINGKRRWGANGSSSTLTKSLIESFGSIRAIITSSRQAGTTGRGEAGTTSKTTTRTFIKSHVRCFTISSAWILSLIIFVMLIRGNIELNPGVKGAPKLSIVTYNCNGLGDRRKLVRLLAKISKLIAKGCIVLLQETHLANLNYFKMLWKHKYISNCKKSNAGGVMILFGNEYTVNSYESDEGGRLIIASIQKEENKFIIANAYFPNDHREAINFTESMYEKLLEFQHTYPNHETICAGDFNTCLKKGEDSMNRVGNNYENQLSISIMENNKITDLEDAYRLVHPKDGYTWKRGTCYSRLDYIFISKSLRHRVSGANTNWAFEASDHAAVQLDLTIKDEISKGPGIVKVNSKILEDVERRKNVEGEIERMMSQIGEDWNPHMILEFLKVSLRKAMSEETGNLRKVMRSEVEDLEQELNQMEQMKITATRDSKDDENIEKARRIEPLNIAINTLKSKLSNVKNKISETREFFNKTKWFEWGEKPNKFFLNLAKSRQNKNLITEIRNGESSHKGQKDVMEGIRNFYKELYEKKNLNRNLDSKKFYEKCPSLSENKNCLGSFQVLWNKNCTTENEKNIDEKID